MLRILAEELDTNEHISPLQPYKIYYLPIPYKAFGTGETLMQAMQSADNEGD
ncbi:hypothetical protein [Microcoleus sp. FACHB-831]|uniref:hypothetical protein n=1 Tax=Microcoleus sp. FACHB-831 TaxID=2692827 RepID=UPI001F54A4FF|nr:hypothetical protein [Microcoleus sp. FACHB-831]